MSGLSCVINKCNRASRALCHCCNQNICLLHLKEHYETLTLQLNPLTDEINVLENRLIDIDVKILMKSTREELDGYRNEYHKVIDQYFEKKSQELEEILIEKVHQQNSDINAIRTALTKFNQEQEVSQKEIDILKTQIQKISENLNDIEFTSIQTNIHPLVLDNNLIEIIENKDPSSILSLPYKTIEDLNIKSPIIVSNDHLLLIHQQSYLCLIDDQLRIIKKLPWHFGSISDICWSATLNRFIMLAEDYGICFVQENTISFDNEKIFGDKLNSCTCSDTSLYLTFGNYGSPILEYRLLPSIELIKQWKSTDICRKDEYISCIRYNNEKLGLSIRKSSEKNLTFELRSVYAFDRLWSIQIDIGLDSYRCCLFNSNDWLFMSTNSSYVLHITKDGKMKRSYNYNTKPSYATLFGRNMLAILTENKINFHKL